MMLILFEFVVIDFVLNFLSVGDGDFDPFFEIGLGLL